MAQDSFWNYKNEGSVSKLKKCMVLIFTLMSRSGAIFLHLKWYPAQWMGNNLGHCISTPDSPRPKWSAYSGHCRAPWIYTASESGQLQCALHHTSVYFQCCTEDSVVGQHPPEPPNLGQDGKLSKPIRSPHGVVRWSAPIMPCLPPNREYANQFTSSHRRSQKVCKYLGKNFYQYATLQG